MEKIVRKFQSFAAQEEAEYEEYRHLSGDEKLQRLLDLIMPENPDAAGLFPERILDYRRAG